ncbi:MAG: LysR family transcriptional regulator [Roseibium album]|uniref:LysR family transcriptional regulator n=1 Tax=Roseibium album TaxID=311410 RepID=UPI000CF1582E|nr:LysR family transcriptional regulator [Roseibium album]MBG6145750.1 DNA-binding transcriptional LysR family regulator [Labrenzia sp. EL_142]MBG6157556.1 DNA-binding transcriptional LysR family regulator [Labrenzia sp. EL_162]MBG6162990.1 DNA-binding transcriptional LysR family regulator [Labrenzia sp. EL_195]MBG6174616.1 DNA-binding transcriptional LysR family regulator [Labrenzia sp. EL_132]MBG6196050.1 DNA-binding transcriptional LysR family regulator [Labrenzia sp. EL_159]MBG6201475.1 D
MEPSLRQIRYFLAAANAGQISRAAMDLNVSQSAITTAIKSLEDLIGARLFERHAGGVSLTYEGNLFLEHARHIIESVEEAVRIPRRIRDDVKGSINLALSYTISGYFFPPFLARFSRAFPNVKINLSEADRPTIEEGLVTNGFDLSVMLTSNIVNHEELAHDTLWRSRRRLWVDAHHKYLQKPSVSLQDVAEEPYIMLTVDEASNTAQRYWNRTPYRPNTIFRTSSVEAVRSMVANGMGVSILSDMVHRPWSLEGRRVEVIEVSDEIPTMDVGLVWHNGRSYSEATKAFIDFMHLGMGTDQSHNFAGTEIRAPVV